MRRFEQVQKKLDFDPKTEPEENTNEPEYIRILNKRKKEEEKKREEKEERRKKLYKSLGV